MGSSWDHDRDATRETKSSSSHSESKISSRSSDDVDHRTTERRHIYEDLRQHLVNLTEKYHAQKRRASNAERELKEAMAQLKKMNEVRLVVLQEAAKVNEELRLYKVQNSEAQKEIDRAQDTIRIIDREKRTAEKEAAEARTMTRKLNQEMLMQAAMEEGRKIGVQDGLKRGRELAIQEAQIRAVYAELERHGQNDDGFYCTRYSSTTSDDGSDRHPSGRTRARPDSVPTTIEEEQENSSQDPALGTPPVRPAMFDTPTIFHNAFPTVHHPHVDIPPEGYIPELDAQQRISIPPPHEFPPSLSVHCPLDDLSTRRVSQSVVADNNHEVPIPTSLTPVDSPKRWPSLRSGRDGQVLADGIYMRPQRNSSSSNIHIPEQPPFNSATIGVSPSWTSYHGSPPGAIRGTGRFTSSTTSEIGLPIPAPFVGMRDGAGGAYATEASDKQTPVIPNPDLFKNNSEDDEMSSTSEDSIATPYPRKYS